MSSVYKKVCPDCASSMRVRNSVGMSELLREVYLECTNVSCGATFGAHLEITTRLSPPAIANPAIKLPDAPAAMRRRAKGASTDDSQMDIDDLLDADDQHQDKAQEQQ